MPPSRKTLQGTFWGRIQRALRLHHASAPCSAFWPYCDAFWGMIPGVEQAMTETETIQYNRFVLAGYDPSTARIMIERGAWLGTAEMLPETVADIEKYRRERDAMWERQSQPEAR